MMDRFLIVMVLLLQIAIIAILAVILSKLPTQSTSMNALKAASNCSYGQCDGYMGYDKPCCDGYKCKNLLDGGKWCIGPANTCDQMCHRASDYGSCMASCTREEADENSEEGVDNEWGVADWGI